MAAAGGRAIGGGFGIWAAGAAVVVVVVVAAAAASISPGLSLLSPAPEPLAPAPPSPLVPPVIAARVSNQNRNLRARPTKSMHKTKTEF